MAIISQNDLLKEQLTTALADKMPFIEKKVLDAVFSIIDKLDTINGEFSGGPLSLDTLLQLASAIDQSLVAGGYADSVNLFISDFGKVTINTSQLLNEVGGFEVTRLQLSDVERKWQYFTQNQLLRSGVAQDFKTPILKILDESISYGGSIDRAKQTLSDYIVGNPDKSGRLTSYSTQIARDSIRGMQGQQFTSIAENIDLAGWKYVGGTLKDTRGQCFHWVREMNGFIPQDQLAYEIRMAYKNQAAKKVIDGIHKYGGMMPNTTIKNFSSNCGGFNCTHTAIPKKKQ
jgi:hypothetical protein